MKSLIEHSKKSERFIGESFLKLVEEKSKELNMPYTEMAKIADINPRTFSNVRVRIRAEGIAPPKWMIIKFMKSGLF